MKIDRSYILMGWIAMAASIVLAFSNPFASLHKKDSITIIMIPKVKDPTNDFWMSMISGAQSAAREKQVSLEILAPDVENDCQSQRQFIKESIKRKPDAIILSPIQYSEMTDTVRKIREAGIPLVLVDSKLSENVEAAYVGTDNEKAGIQMGNLLRKYVKNGSEIAIMSYIPGASTAIEREKGVSKGLGEFKDRIETVLYSNSDYSEAFRLTKKLLKEQPEVDLIAGLNLYSTVGVARAIKEMGAARRVHVIGFDNDVEGILYLEEGIIDALIVQKPFNMGYLAVLKSLEVVKKEVGETEVYCETEIITRDNIYTDENQKLLFPF